MYGKSSNQFTASLCEHLGQLLVWLTDIHRSTDTLLWRVVLPVARNMSYKSEGSPPSLTEAVPVQLGCKPGHKWNHYNGTDGWPHSGNEERTHPFSSSCTSLAFDTTIHEIQLFHQEEVTDTQIDVLRWFQSFPTGTAFLIFISFPQLSFVTFHKNQFPSGLLRNLCLLLLGREIAFKCQQYVCVWHTQHKLVFTACNCITST